MSLTLLREKQLRRHRNIKEIVRLVIAKEYLIDRRGGFLNPLRERVLKEINKVS